MVKLNDLTRTTATTNNQGLEKKFWQFPIQGQVYIVFRAAV